MVASFGINQPLNIDLFYADHQVESTWNRKLDCLAAAGD
jgi:hypothetical protein